MFDFSVAKVEQSFKESLQKLQLPYVDLIQVKSFQTKQTFVFELLMHFF